MFTGLVAELGTVRGLKRVQNSYHLTVAARKVLDNLKIGDSVAVNGVCLTVVVLGSGEFTADVMDGLDGHIVSGHVEGIGVIAKCRQDGIANVVTVKTPPELMRYILHKGSIAIDGISLTVTDVTEDTFSVSLIPHTSKETTLGFKTVGDEVNLETDIIGKYVEQMLKFGNKAEKKDETSVLSKATLFENGFM